jgi:hypothetical protein
VGVGGRLDRRDGVGVDLVFRRAGRRGLVVRLWADRIVQSAVAEQAVARGLATSDELRALADAWRTWGAAPDAWFVVLHGELLARA